jgi:iron-sulfur cluster assembly protein
MSIEITSRAVEEIKKVMLEQDMKDTEYVLRVGIAGGGCSGFSYSLTFDKVENINEEVDDIYTFEGLRAVVDRKSDLYLSGTSVDFFSGLEKRGFVFNNPNATHKCGCGSSFGV